MCELRAICHADPKIKLLGLDTGGNNGKYQLVVGVDI